MADTAAPVVTPKAAKKKAAAKPKKPAMHPKYSEMIRAAVSSLKERRGSSRQAILKYAMANYKVGDEKAANVNLKRALKAGVKNGALKQSKGTGASGSFKLGETKKVAKLKKATNPKATKPKRAAKPKKPAVHPKYSEMIQAAVSSFNERGGSSRQAILKYVMANYKVGDEKTANIYLKRALNAGVKNGALKQSKGTGASGSFKLGETKKVAKLKKATNPKATKPKRAAKPKKPAVHPKYSEMIQAAVSSFNERGGSSRQAILKYVMANYKVGDEKTANIYLKRALNAGVKNGALKQSKGTGASGSFKLGEMKKATKPKKATNPKAAKPKRTAKPKKPAVHSKYSDMIQTAVSSLKERGGSSRQAILKYAMANYKVGDEKAATVHLKRAIKAGVKNGVLKQSKGTGASVSFKLGETKKAAKPKKANNPKAAKPKKAKLLKKARTVTPIAVTPSISRYTGNNTNRYFHLTWSPPDDVQVHLIHGYFVEQTLVGSSFGWIRLNDNILESTEYIARDLEPGKWYKYRIVVVKDEAEYICDDTDAMQAIHVPLRPSQPVVYDITNRSCVLEWMAPDFDGGSPITRYEVKIKQDDKTWKYGCSVSGDKLSTKVENLSENKTYRFRIRAVNIAGHGKKSTESEAIKAIGIDLSDTCSLVQYEPVALERKGMESVTKSFEIGISYFIKLMESLSKLTSSVTYRESDVINKDVWLYSERLYNHMQNTLDKIETVNLEINKRIEEVMFEISRKEKEQRQNEIKSAKLDQQIRNLQSELEDLRKEKSEAVEKYEKIKRDLQEAEKKLRKARRTQDAVKVVGTVGLFIPIVGWAVSAVTLPIAFTVLQDNVDAAKNRVDSEYNYKRAKEQQVDSKESEIRRNKDSSQTLQDNKEQLNNDIRRMKKLRKSLKRNLNLQAEASVKMKKCLHFVGGAHCRAEVLHGQMKYFYDLSAVIKPLRDMARHLSSKQASALGMLPSNLQVGIAAGKLQMIAAAAECQAALNTPSYLKDFTEVPTMVDGSDGTRAIMEIHSLSQDLSSCSHDDERIILTEYVNCSGFLGSAPATNALIGQLLLISLKHDFAIDEKMPVGGFKFLKQPKSFRVSMFQTANAASDAFFLAHRNMDQINLYSKTSPTHLTKALQMLESGSPQEICRLLSRPLMIIKDTSEKCLHLAKAVQQKFKDVVSLMDELQEACVSTKSQTDKKQQEHKAMRIDAEQEKANWESKKLLSEAEAKRKKHSLQHDQDMFEKAKSKYVTKGVLEGVAYNALSKLFGPSSKKKRKANKDTTLNRSGQTEDKKPPKPFEDIDIDVAETLLEDAVTLENNTKKLHAALCKMKETNILLDVRTCKAKYKRIKRRDCYLSKEHAQIKHALSLSDIGLSLCRDLLPLCEGMNCEDQQRLELKASVEAFYKQCETLVEEIQALKVDADRKWKVVLEKKMKINDSDNTETGNYDLDQLKYKVNITFSRMVKADAEHDRAAKKAKRARRELANIVSEIAGLEMEKLDLNQIIDLLCRCLKQLGNLKEEWSKMVSLFQKITNIIDTTLNTSLKGFADVANTTEFDKPETFKLSSLKRQMLYDKVMKASEVAYFIQHFTESYTEVSEKFFLPVLEVMPRLLKSSGNKSPQIEDKLKQLQTESIAAQKGINDHLDRKQRHFKSTIKARLAAIEECLHTSIPEIESSCTGTVEQRNTGIYDPDDFV